jgi:hypothetical protein
MLDRTDIKILVDLMLQLRSIVLARVDVVVGCVGLCSGRRIYVGVVRYVHIKPPYTHHNFANVLEADG